MAFDPTKVGKSLTQAGNAGASTGKKIIKASVSTRALARALADNGQVVPSLRSVADNVANADDMKEAGNGLVESGTALADAGVAMGG